MAELTGEQHGRLLKGFMRLISREKIATGLTKTQLSEAAAALDTWINSNQAAINQALPTAAQAESTAFKTLLFCAIALMRVSQAFAKRILEVD